MNLIFCSSLLAALGLFNLVEAQDAYTAAILEYHPKDNGYRQLNFENNVKEYLRFLGEAKRNEADIIVFPEDGLTGWDVNEDDLSEYSTEVPLPAKFISPCNAQHTEYAKFLGDFACAARRNRIYVILNLIEREFNELTNTTFYFNTNVVFDRNGVVIAKYRKINLFDEPEYVPGPHQLSTFKTDFGVTFGMFICFDLLFKVPAQDVLQNREVTDIVYSAAWFSELPFYEANSVQHGYAKANGVNLLAAGLNDPSQRNGGSGIYLADGRILATYVSGAKASKLLIRKVPKIKSRKDLSNTCQGASTSPTPLTPIGINEPDISYFETMATDLSNYTFKTLDLKSSQISETVCSRGSSFCCSFNMSITNYSHSWQSYVYKIVAYDGVSKVSETKTIGVRNCGLVACVNETDQSCGERSKVSPIGINFNSIALTATFSRNNSHYRPATLKYDLTPMSDYVYCRESSAGEEHVNLYTTKPHDNIFTFGILGRTFDNDDKEQGFVSAASSTSIFGIYPLTLFILYFRLI